MRRAFAFSLFLFLGSSQISEADTRFDVQIIGRYTFSNASMGVSSTGTANYSGSDVGGEVIIKNESPKSNSAKYGFGVVGGYNSRNMDNTASTSTTETLKGNVVSAGVRFYALDLYVGSSILYSTFKVDYKGSTSVINQYSALGVRLETGIDLYLGKNVLFAPKIQYDIMSASQDESSTTKKINSFGASLGLGMRF